MDGRIVVINPNSSEACTRAIDAALDSLRGPEAPEIVCLTLAEGPPGVESQCDADGVVVPLCRLAGRHAPEAAAFVVACFSDPGVQALRERTPKPVLGIAEAGLLTALTLGERLGIVSILANSVVRHRRFLRALGIEGRVAGDIALGLGVGALEDATTAYARLRAVAERLRDAHEADVIVLGCAGMAGYRQRLEADLGLPVIDPTQAAVGMAITAARLGYRTAAQRTRG